MSDNNNENKTHKSDIEKQKRIENYEKQRTNLLQQGYQESVRIISIVKINILAFVTAGPFVIVAFLIYFGVWGEFSIELNLFESFFLLISIILSIPIHECLHGFGWHFFCKDKWKSICFGVIWQYLTPFCHCKEPLKFKHYLFGGLMPFFVLGIGVSALGVIFHSSILLLIGLYNIIAAGGDTTIACVAFKYHNSILMDHPSECGFIEFHKNETI